MKAMLTLFDTNGLMLSAPTPSKWIMTSTGIEMKEQVAFNITSAGCIAGIKMHGPKGYIMTMDELMGLVFKGSRFMFTGSTFYLDTVTLRWNHTMKK